MQTARLNESLTDGWALTKGRNFPLIKKKKLNKTKEDFQVLPSRKHQNQWPGGFYELFFLPFFACTAAPWAVETLWHTLSLQCMHTIQLYLQLWLSLSLSLSPLLFHPSWLWPLLPLVFLSRSLYLPPMAESGRATGSKTCRLQNVGQPSVQSYRLETAVCVRRPLALRVAMQAGVSEPCRQAARFPRSVPQTRAPLLLSSPSRQAE